MSSANKTDLTELLKLMASRLYRKEKEVDQEWSLAGLPV
jgi:hypothetical protein